MFLLGWEIAAIKAGFGFLSIMFCLSLVTVLGGFLPAKQNLKEQLSARFYSSIWEIQENILREY